MPGSSPAIAGSFPGLDADAASRPGAQPDDRHAGSGSEDDEQDHLFSGTKGQRKIVLPGAREEEQ